MDHHHHHQHSMTGDEMSYSHMTFFWGSHSEILFSGWPGASSGMYFLALVLVFILSVLVEWFDHCRLIRSGSTSIATGLAQTAVHAVRVGLAYVLMLAVMSFNGGVLIAAVVGHALGFLLFGTSLFKRSKPGEGASEADLPPMASS